MMRIAVPAFSMNWQKRVLEDCDSGMEARQIALKLTVKKSSGLRSRTVPMSLKNVATGEIGKAS